MKLEPHTFFLGVIDFFSVMLPGAVVVALVQGQAYPLLFPAVFPEYRGEPAGWAIFLFASYLAGHFVFLLGSWIDLVYDALRGAANSPAKGDKAPWRSTRWLAARLFPDTADLALANVRALKQACIPDVGDKPVINAFQWAKARLMIHCPAALADVQRYEADSKFFRSFVVVLLLLSGWLAARVLAGTPALWPFVLAGLGLAALSFWRYVERRFKAIEQAYRYVLTLEHDRPAGPGSPP